MEHKWNNTGRINQTTQRQTSPTGTLLTTNSAWNTLQLILFFNQILYDTRLVKSWRINV